MMAEWTMIDRRDSGGLLGDAATTVLALEYTEMVNAGEALTFRPHIGLSETVYFGNTWACENHNAPNNWGHHLLIDAVTYPQNDRLGTGNICVGRGPDAFEPYEFTVPSPDDPGAYQIRLLFLEDLGQYNGTAFPESYHDDWVLPGEVVVPVEVGDQDAPTGCDETGDCPLGYECVNGTCVPYSDANPVDCGGCPPGYECYDGACVPYSEIPGDGDGETGGGSGGRGVLAGAVGIGAAYLYLRRQRGND